MKMRTVNTAKSPLQPTIPKVSLAMCGKHETPLNENNTTTQPRKKLEEKEKMKPIKTLLLSSATVCSSSHGSPMPP
jgi:hypothetical protein